MKYTFTASIIKERKWYVAYAVELGVTSQGKTIASAKKNLSEAVALYLEEEPQAKEFISRKQPILAKLEVSG